MASGASELDEHGASVATSVKIANTKNDETLPLHDFQKIAPKLLIPNGWCRKFLKKWGFGVELGSTVPWDTIEQFEQVRTAWEAYNDPPKCLKSIEEFQQWAVYLENSTFMDANKRRYLHKVDGGAQRLRQQLCRAFKHGAAGVQTTPSLSAEQFAQLLTDHGIDCKKSDVQNAKKNQFTPHQCPSTPGVQSLLEKLKANAFPDIDINQFVDNEPFDNGISLSRLQNCSFTQKLN